MTNITSIIITNQFDLEVISEAVSSCHSFSKILIVSSTKDNQIEKICSKFKAELIVHPFVDFADQRNYAFLHANTDWVLFVDSDEKLTPEFKSEVIAICKNQPNENDPKGYFIKRKTFFYGKDWGVEDKVQRLFYRKNFIEWKGTVHETPAIRGSFGIIKSPIEHYTHRNLSQMIRKTNDWSEFEARLRLKSNHPTLQPWRFLRVMMTEFFHSYVRGKGYKNGTYGIIEAIYQSYSIFITYAKLWEMQNKKINSSGTRT